MSLTLGLGGGHAQNLDTIYHHVDIIPYLNVWKKSFYLKVCFYACFLCAVIMPERHWDRPKIFLWNACPMSKFVKSTILPGKSLTGPIPLSQATDQTWSYQSAQRRKQIAILRIQSERRHDVCSIFSSSFYWIWNCKQDTRNQSSCKITRIRLKQRLVFILFPEFVFLVHFGCNFEQQYAVLEILLQDRLGFILA
jgi:hypothetical protein